MEYSGLSCPMAFRGRRPLVTLAFSLACVGFLVAAPLAPAAPPPAGDKEVVPKPDTDLLGSGEVEGVRPVGRDTVVFLDADVAPPSQGNSVVVPVSDDAPEGVLGMVTSVTELPDGRTRVRTRPEPLAAAYTEYELDLEGKTLEDLMASEAKASGLLDHLTQALHCEGSGRASARTVARIGKLVPRVEIDLRRKEFRFELRGKPEVGGEFEAHGDQTCEPRNLPAISIPLPAHGLPLFLTIAPAAKAEVEGNFESSFLLKPDLVAGVERTAKRDAQPFHSFRLGQPGEPDVKGNGHVAVDLGVEVGLSLAGRVGVSGTTGPRIDATFDLSPTSFCHSATGSAYMELTGRANFFIRKWEFQIHRLNFGSKQFWQAGDCGATA